jgi:hypothetical protein
VIGALFTPYRGADSCTAEAVIVPASVTLSAPLGTRALLNVGNGYPAVVGARNQTPITWAAGRRRDHVPDTKR